MSTPLAWKNVQSDQRKNCKIRKKKRNGFLF